MTYCSRCGWNDILHPDDEKLIAKGKMISTRHIHCSIEEGIPECSSCTGRKENCPLCNYPIIGYIEKWRLGLS